MGVKPALGEKGGGGVLLDWCHDLFVNGDEQLAYGGGLGLMSSGTRLVEMVIRVHFWTRVTIQLGLMHWKHWT